MIVIGILIAAFEERVPARIRDILLPLVMVLTVIPLAGRIRIPSLRPEENFNARASLGGVVLVKD